MIKGCNHDTYREIFLAPLTEESLSELSNSMGLSLSQPDMTTIQHHFSELNRALTDVELEVIAQTWSEHCKHRTFHARIEHQTDTGTEQIDSLFNTYIRNPTRDICASKTGFVLSAFEDNAGFIKIDKNMAACLKVETHNHPSAIEPYAGANTGIGGVIRDILAAGKGAKPVANVDVFCFGNLDAKVNDLPAGIIHPRGIMRGVVKGVADYGNRMGIPTLGGAVHFHHRYTCNPLVFCGTAGIIPITEIPKHTQPDMLLLLAGGRTGRDGLHGATFSSATLDTDSHAEDMGAVQIGNPIEEKKVADFVLHARRENLIRDINDCGAGGLSSAVGELLANTGGTVNLDEVPLKEPDLLSWEIFLSESQERMVIVIDPDDLDQIKELAEMYETECTVIGRADDSSQLRVTHSSQTVCDLDIDFLHHPPQKSLQSKYAAPRIQAVSPGKSVSKGEALHSLLSNCNICSREPIIRQYDHEVQGNTIIKPLAGPGGDCPQDAAVIKIRHTDKYCSIGTALLPPAGIIDPWYMGMAVVDEAVRQVVVTGADPARIALLDNFCAGDPNDPEHLGAVVECIKGMSSAVRAYKTPFISGKDSFHNTYQTDAGTEAVPVTLLITSIGVIDDIQHVAGTSIRSDNSLLCLLGTTHPLLASDVFPTDTPCSKSDFEPETAAKLYNAFYKAIKSGAILSAHDVSEGGLAVALAEMAFSLKAGLEIELQPVLHRGELSINDYLFSETCGRIIFEIDTNKLSEIELLFASLPMAVIGQTTNRHRELRINKNSKHILSESLEELKESWQKPLKPYC